MWLHKAYLVDTSTYVEDDICESDTATLNPGGIIEFWDVHGSDMGGGLYSIEAMKVNLIRKFVRKNPSVDQSWGLGWNSLLEMNFKGLHICIASGGGNIQYASVKKQMLTHRSVEEAKMWDLVHPQCNMYRVPETWDSDET